MQSDSERKREEIKD